MHRTAKNTRNAQLVQIYGNYLGYGAYKRCAAVNNIARERLFCNNHNVLQVRIG